jgi:hypothetical protein
MYWGMVFVCHRKKKWHFTTHVYRGMGRKLTASDPHVTGCRTIPCRLPHGSVGESRQETVLNRPYNYAITTASKKINSILTEQKYSTRIKLCVIWESSIDFKLENYKKPFVLFHWDSRGSVKSAGTAVYTIPHFVAKINEPKRRDDIYWY